MKNKIIELIKASRKEQKEINKRLKTIHAWLQTHAESLSAAELEPQILGNWGIDFNFLSHEKTVELMKIVVVGKWNKHYNDNSINYEAKVDGISIRIYNGEPPPNCQIVEQEVIVAAQYVPEHVEKRRKLVCKQEEIESTDPIEP